MIEHTRNALDNGESKPETAGDLGAPFKAMKFGEHSLALVRWNADSRIEDIDAQPLPAAAAADQNAPGSRILDGVGNEVLQHPTQQPPIGPYVERTRHDDEIKALVASERRKIGLESAKQLVNPEACNFGFHRAGIQPRDLEQSGEDVLDGFERGVDVGNELRLAPTLPSPASGGGKGGGEAFDEARHIEPCGIQRLKDVMACGGKKSRL